MLRKILVAFVSICFVFMNAQASTHNGLKAAFDELNYSLQIEWDQQDKTFYDQQMKKFSEVVKDVPQQELMKFALTNVKDAKTAKDLEKAMNLISVTKMPHQEAQDLISNILTKSYNEGASWSGAAAAGFLVAILLIALVAVSTGSAKVTDECVEVYTCKDYCTGNLCYEDCNYECL